MNHQDEPSNLDFFIAEITGSAESNYFGVQHQVPFRIHHHLYAKLSAIIALADANKPARSKRANSRNAVLNDLLQIALDQVYSKVSDSDLANLKDLESNFLTGTLKYIEEQA
jgi:hypothetical protein